MNTKTARQIATTHILPVVVATAIFALVLAYGPAVISFAVEVIQGLWDGIVSAFTSASAAIDHMFAIGQNARPASGLACWNEIKTGLPTEHLCGDVVGAPASAVDFTSYPTN